MDKIEKKVIIILLILIIGLATKLIYNYTTEKVPDKKLYTQIYSEYAEMQDSSNVETNKNQEEVPKISNSAQLEKKSEDDSKVIGKIEIPKINISYPIIYKTTDEFLKIAPTKLAGNNLNEKGNVCIIAHNYKRGDDEFFSRLGELNIGNNVFVTSKTSGKKSMYKVYKKYEVLEDDLSCLDQTTNGKKEITLITCTANKKKRLVVKCEESI